MLVEEALKQIKARLKPKLGSENVPVRSGLGRILSKDVTSPIAVPQYNNSAVDGFAFRYKDLIPNSTTALQLSGIASAGEHIDKRYEPCSAVRIYTGARIPLDLDTIVMQEDCVIENNTIYVPWGIKPATNCRKAGEDINRGSIVLSSGHRLRPQDIGLIASTGQSQVSVYRRLRVALFSTGNEIREPGTHLDDNSIFDSNRFSLMALLDALGCRTTDLGILKDHSDIIREAIGNAALSHDLILTSGGVSVGDEDHVRTTIEAIGSVSIWRLAIKPGKPLLMGQIKGAAFVGMPGNPAAVMVTFLRLVRPLVLRLAGANNLTPVFFAVRSGFSYNKKPNRREWIRVLLTKGSDGRLVAQKFEHQGSGILTSVVESDGLVELPEDLTFLERGSIIQFLPFSEVLS